MKSAGIAVVIFAVIWQPVVTDFDCEDKDFSTGTCEGELFCLYQEEYEEREGYSKYCRCRILISDLPLPHNELKLDKFKKICSLHKTRLQQLWVIDANLEFIENDIFINYPNLRYLNLAGNRLRLNFSRLAENVTELDVSNNGLNLIQEGALDNLKSLKMLNVSFNRLDKVNSCFDNLTALEEIYLRHNHLLKILHGEFDHLEKLRVLDLAYNLITTIDFSLYLPNLQELYLDNNGLTNTGEGNLDVHFDLPNLRILKLNNNSISDLTGNHLLSNLEEYYLEHNFIKEIDGYHLYDLPNLKLLNMSNNQINNVSNSTFRELNNLQIMDLSSNQVAYISLLNFQNLSFLNLNRNNLSMRTIWCANTGSMGKLNELYLSHNKFGEIEECTFRRLKTLSKLSLQATDLKAIPPRAFENLRILKELNLAENQIAQFPTSTFVQLSDLRILNISHNNLTSFNFTILDNNTRITDFDIKDNPLKDLDLRILRNKLPELKVVDFDSNLVKCDAYGEIFKYFDENSVVLKSCPSARDCCDYSGFSVKLFIITAVVAAVCVLAIIGLFAVLCIICKCNARPTHSAQLVAMQPHNY